MATTPPAPGGRGAGGVRSGRRLAVVGAAVAAVVLLAILADGRLLVADPDASAVTAADVRLARALARSGVDPETLAPACFDEAGDIDLRCLGDGEIPEEVVAEIVPRSCRDESGVSASCLEEEVGIDIPDRCRSGDDVDVACLAGEGTALVLTDRCVTDSGFRVRSDCLSRGVYGVPAPADEVTVYRPTVTTAATRPDDTGASTLPERPRRDEAEDEGDDLADVVGAVAQALAVLVVVGVIVLALVIGARLLTGWRPTRSGPPATPEEADEEHDRAVMAASVAASARQLDLSGEPRQAIIAAYAMLLEGLAACAQGRHPAETPLEHLERVLAALDVQPDPLRELTGLFGEARFSDHAMTEAQTDRARAALEAAASDLDRVRETVGG